jgi:acyl transferase domain-containing protein
MLDAGQTQGIVQPSSKAQADLIRATYRSADLAPHLTGYFEAHGTGTALGDPVEVNALVDALETKGRAINEPLYIAASQSVCNNVMRMLTIC